MLRPSTRTRSDDWTALPLPLRPETAAPGSAADASDEDPTDSERRQQPELNRVEPVEKKAPLENEFEIGLADEAEDDTVHNSRMNRLMQGVARQVSLDPGDGMEL